MDTGTVSLWIQAVIAIAALLALRQISISKKSFRLNSQRESIKYASELVKEYVHELIPEQDKAMATLEKINFKQYKGDFNLKSFTYEEVSQIGGSLQQHFLYANQTLEPAKETNPLQQLLTCINVMEAFAVPFVSGVADEQVAFNSVGLTYCSTIKNWYFMYIFVRHKNSDKFKFFSNSIMLYNWWSDRIKEANLKALEQGIQRSLAEIAHEVNRPIGTN